MFTTTNGSKSVQLISITHLINNSNNSINGNHVLTTNAIQNYIR